MNIVFDARMVHYRRAGIGQYAVSLLRALAASPDVGPHARFQVLQMRGHKELFVRDRRFRRVPMWTPPHNRFEQPALGLELLKLRPRPQLIHSPDFVPPRYRRFPAVVNIQDLAFLKFPGMTLLTGESKRYYSQVYRAARDAEALIALSHSARDDIVSLLGVKPDKVAVIPAAAGDEFRPPLDVKEAQNVAAREFGLPAPAEGGYILFVSTIEPRKNLLVLLEAYRQLLDHKRVSPTPALAIAGSEGWLYEKVYERIDSLKLRDNVRLLGMVAGERLPRLYQGARAFVLPSIYEGFGLPALEAMACGVPVLASTGGSLPEVVGDAGILLDPHDAEDWSAALERVLLDEEEERRLRQAGPLQAANFSWTKAASQTWALYLRVLRGEGSRIRG
ncbi:MAG TPA: glycosyltransferase family 1 protein [Chloroflexia bacterium]|nr:glycosyltransferase family 1 protein [Chloroflexia bacterium]